MSGLLLSDVSITSLSICPSSSSFRFLRDFYRKSFFSTIVKEPKYFDFGRCIQNEALRCANRAQTGCGGLAVSRDLWFSNVLLFNTTGSEGDGTASFCDTLQKTHYFTYACCTHFYGFLPVWTFCRACMCMLKHTCMIHDESCRRCPVVNVWHLCFLHPQAKRSTLAPVVTISCLDSCCQMPSGAEVSIQHRKFINNVHVK